MCLSQNTENLIGTLIKNKPTKKSCLHQYYKINIKEKRLKYGLRQCQTTLLGSVQSIQPSSTQQLLDKIFTMVNGQHVRDKELNPEKVDEKVWGKKKKK